MDALFVYEVEGFIDSLVTLFGFVPVGFLLGMLFGFLAFGIFGLLRLVKGLIK